MSQGSVFVVAGTRACGRRDSFWWLQGSVLVVAGNGASTPFTIRKCVGSNNELHADKASNEPNLARRHDFVSYYLKT